MENVAVIGAGFAGLVNALGHADLGNHVYYFDTGGVLDSSRNTQKERLSLAASYAEAIHGAEFIIIAGVLMRDMLTVVESIADALDHPLTIINKSAVPVGTGDWVAEIIRNRRPDAPEFAVVSCPEFLREGSAISDFMNPDRTVLGSTHKDAAAKVAQLHLPLRSAIMITDLRTAEMIKYASNAFLATKISFINEIANICEALGADVKEVAAGMGLDKRIGRFFLDAGIGWGGSCFPKDVKALAYMAETEGRHPHLLHAVMDINADQRQAPVRKLREIFPEDLKGKVVGLLGLAFKPNTDDMRDAPSIDIVHSLLRAGARVRAYDPVAMPGASALLPDVEMMPDPYTLAEGADALILVTEWNEFKHLDLARIKTVLRAPVFIDGRNIYDPQTMAALGFIYRGIGRGYNGEGVSESAC